MKNFKVFKKFELNCILLGLCFLNLLIIFIKILLSIPEGNIFIEFQVFSKQIVTYGRKLIKIMINYALIINKLKNFQVFKKLQLISILLGSKLYIFFKN